MDYIEKNKDNVFILQNERITWNEGAVYLGVALL